MEYAMLEADPSTNRRREQKGQKTWATSALLITLTVAVALGCIIILMCTLTQTRVAALVIEGVGISIPKLDYVGRKWVTNRNDYYQLLEMEKAINGFLAAEADARTAANGKSQNLEDKLTVFFYRIENVDSELANAIRNKKPFEQYGRIVGKKIELIGRASEFGPLIDEVEHVYN